MSAKRILLDQFDLHNVLYNNVTADISDEEAGKCIADPMNSVKWLAGHLAWAQLNLANIGRTEVDFAWRDHFHTKQGATPQDLSAPPSEMPSLQEIIDKWNEMGPQIRTALANLPDQVFDTEIDVPHPIAPFDKTIGGLWAFINHHQAYTIGQIGILRRGLGKDAMKYFAV